MTIVRTAEVASPVGAIFFAVTEDDRVCALVFEDFREQAIAELERRFGKVELRASRDPAGVATRLRTYLQGDLRALDGIEVDLGGTEFQRAVWRALRDVPPGETRSYQQLARAVGRPRAIRAVGAANGQNPVSLIVPCHRIIGADGKLTGYGGGLDRKRWLLVHERALLA